MSSYSPASRKAPSPAPSFISRSYLLLLALTVTSLAACSLSATPASSQYQLYLRYLPVIQSDSATLQASTAIVAITCAQISSLSLAQLHSCAAAFDQVTLASNKFTADLNAHPAPDCLKPEDQILRTSLLALATASSAASLAITNGASLPSLSDAVTQFNAAQHAFATALLALKSAKC